MNEQQDTINYKKAATILLWMGILALFIYSVQAKIEFSAFTNPDRYVVLVRIMAALLNPNFADASSWVFEQMWETFQIAFVATMLSAAIALPIAYLCIRPSSTLGPLLNIIIQPIVAAVSAVHPLVSTIVWVPFVGLGATAGVFSLTIFSFAVFIAIFTDFARDNPAISLPNLLRVYFPALAFKHFHVNIMIATVLGFFGAGGIGFSLQQSINLLNFRSASVAILACIITVGTFDLLGRAVWRRIHTGGRHTQTEHE